MEMLNEINIFSINAFFYLLIGLILLKGISLLSKCCFKKNKSNNVKSSMLELMKNTPLIYIKSLSELSGCNIYGKCEYYLPYTSKDRMIKNIIFDAEK
jgi:hypothetical protein